MTSKSITIQNVEFTKVHKNKVYQLRTLHLISTKTIGDKHGLTNAFYIAGELYVDGNKVTEMPSIVYGYSLYHQSEGMADYHKLPLVEINLMRDAAEHVVNNQIIERC